MSLRSPSGRPLLARVPRPARRQQPDPNPSRRTVWSSTPQALLAAAVVSGLMLARRHPGRHFRKPRPQSTVYRPYWAVYGLFLSASSAQETIGQSDQGTHSSPTHSATAEPATGELLESTCRGPRSTCYITIALATKRTLPGQLHSRVSIRLLATPASYC